MAVVVWIVSGFLTWGLVAASRRLVDFSAFRGPLRIGLASAGFRGAMELTPPSALLRLFIERGLGLIFCLGLAWTGAVLVDLIGERWHSRLDPRMQAVSYSVLPLVRQVVKMALFLMAILGVLSYWGYNTTAILAGVGVGGIAVALAAQKTIENLFGGISVISDRPVLVGDVCRFGDRTGTVIHIGLRSTRIRTPDRTVVSVPNGQFAIHDARKHFRTRQDLVPPHAKSPPGHDFRTVIAGAGFASRDPGESSQSGNGHYTGALHRRGGLFAGRRSGRVREDCLTTMNFSPSSRNCCYQMLQAVEQAGTALAVPLQESFAVPLPPQV